MTWTVRYIFSLIVALFKARETIIREQWVNVMKMRLVRLKMEKCYRFEGANHIENCRDLAEKYLGMLQDPKNKIRGYKLAEIVEWD